jgi:hypothetical protein
VVAKHIKLGMGQPRKSFKQMRDLRPVKARKEI